MLYFAQLFKGNTIYCVFFIDKQINVRYISFHFGTKTYAAYRA
ncbi:MAG: hypothetical protein JWN60_510 [Acidobacteria bacterium]|jgi:hypothetical protein|nr:hypothetical protein [Acidobacteriota bacterium]